MLTFATAAGLVLTLATSVDFAAVFADDFETSSGFAAAFAALAAAMRRLTRPSLFRITHSFYPFRRR
ncbi:hypothetical protein [Catenulispora pinisilvae]|uniref:hypothetical protein n=1 Tax=Catenulispora pinisilvae TaxID=2705253 RepID=UPI0018919292|nr:hypothetical protein [Catenulispora pinisilvae]